MRELKMSPQVEVSYWTLETAYREIRKYVCRKLDDAKLFTQDSTYLQVDRSGFIRDYLGPMVPSFADYLVLPPAVCGLNTSPPL
jgi:hypothetical protein